MRLFLSAVVSASLALPPGATRAEFLSGNDLKAKLDKEDAADKTSYLVGLGYVIGVADAAAGTHVCITGPVTAGQVASVVRKYIAANPDKLEKGADVLVVWALREFWPCEKKPASASPQKPKAKPKAKPSEDSPF